jgi:hypothetical protein
MAENPSRSNPPEKRAAEPEPEKFPAEQLIAYHSVWFDSSPDLVAAALATAPANRSNFTVDEVKELLRAREGVVLDPYAGVPETYPVPVSHLLARPEARRAGRPLGP